jgi:hypothetical protein
MERQKRHIARLKKKIARFELKGRDASGLMRDLAIQSGVEEAPRAGRPGKPKIRFLGKSICCWPKNKMIDSMIDRGGKVSDGAGSKRPPRADVLLKSTLDAIAKIEKEEGS